MLRFLILGLVYLGFLSSLNNSFSQNNILISQGGTVSVSNGDFFYDAGGPSGNDGISNYTITLTPSTAGESICIDFTLYNSNGTLDIYDGLTTAANNIGTLQGNYGIDYNANGSTPFGTGQKNISGVPDVTSPGIFCANNSSGALTLSFTKIGSQSIGWVGNIKTYVRAITGCNVDITASPNSICSGASTTLLATGTIGNALLSNDFNSGVIGAGWSSTASVSFLNVLSCEPNNGHTTMNTDNSTYIWMQSAAAPRSLETNGFNVSNGGYLMYDFRAAADDNGGNGCEANDNEEGVYVQYSTNNGATWVNLKLMFPGPESSQGASASIGCGMYIYDWNKNTIPLPAAALSANTKFRWYQNSSTTASQDSWGVDNVSIVKYAPATLTITDLSTNTILTTTTSTTASIVVSPTVTTTYRATLTDGTSTCIKDIIVTVTGGGSGAPTIGTITQPTCTNATGSVVLNGLPATGTWTINPGAITGTGTSTTINNLTAGTTYNFTVTSASGCASASSANVVINPQPTAPSAPTIGTITQPTCSNSTGSVILNGLPATGTWTINPGAITGTGTSTTINNLAAGTTYTFTVTNASGCTSASSANVVINPQPTAPSAPTIGTITQPTCSNSTGSVVLNGLPATGTWTINPGAITGTGTSTTINNLAAGTTYNFTVTNASGCTSASSANVVINTPPGAPNSPTIGTITQPNCIQATGSVVLTGLPATGTWTINPGAITGTGTSTTINNLTAGTTYNFTVTNTSGCISSPSANVVINAQPLANNAPTIGTITQPTCTNATGSVVLNGLPATGTWTINPGAITGTGTSTTINNLTAGTTYNFTVTNASGCISSTSANVVINTQPTSPAAPSVGTITQPTCATPNGSVILNGLPASGTWTINPGAISGTGTSTTINNLTAGTTYNFTVTNVSGCTSPASANVVINTPPGAPTAPTLGTLTQPTCSVATASAVLNGLPSSGTWSINPGAITGTGTSTTINNLTAGTTYNFTVTNTSGCSSGPLSVVVNAQPTTPSAPTLGTITQPTCTNATGSVVLNGLPATGTWTINPGAITGTGTSTTINNLAAGTTYNYTVTNASGCVSPASGNAVINPAPTAPTAPVIASITQPTCTSPTGVINLTGLPASGNWTLTTNPGNVTTNGSGTTNSLSGLAPNTTYTFTVSDANGCTSPVSANGVMNAVPTASPADAGTYAAVCIDHGLIALAGSPAGGVFSGTGVNGTDFDPSNGTQTITYTYVDANGCSSNDQTQITVNPLPTVNAGQDQTLCEGDAFIFNATGAANYVWDNGGVQGTTITPALGTVTYTVTGTDTNGCVNTDQMTLTVNGTPVVNFIADQSQICAGESITFTNLTGNSSNCQWSISNGYTSNLCGSITVPFNQAGLFSVTLSISNGGAGCSNSLTLTNMIEVFEIPNASFSPSKFELTTNNTQVNFVNSSTNATDYQWNFGFNNDQSTDVNPNYTYPSEDPGVYVVTLIASNPAGCVDTASHVIRVIEDLIYYIPNSFTPDEDEFNPTFKPVFTSGFDPYDYTLFIFNRWGELIFESHDVHIGWSGNYAGDGNKCQADIYTWKVEFKALDSDKHIVDVGHINLIK